MDIPWYPIDRKWQICSRSRAILVARVGKSPQIPLEDRNSNQSVHRPISKSISTPILGTSRGTALEVINLRNSQSNRDMSIRKLEQDQETLPTATVVTIVLNVFCPRSSDANLLHISCLSRTHPANTCIEQWHRPGRTTRSQSIQWNMLNCGTGKSFSLRLRHSLKRRAVAQLVVALLYKPEVRGFDSRLCHWNLSLT